MLARLPVRISGGTATDNPDIEAYREQVSVNALDAVAIIAHPWEAKPAQPPLYLAPAGDHSNRRQHVNLTERKQIMPTGDTVRFLHSADWQLGMTRAFLNPEAASRFSQARIDAITRMGELAIHHGAAFIVVAGDVFESNRVSQTTVMRAVDALAGLTVPVFLLPGNHDPLDATSLFHSSLLQAAGKHVFIIRDTQPVQVPGLPHVEVVGAPWTSKRPTTEPCAAMLEQLQPRSDTLRVAVCHGQVDTLSPDTSQPGVIDLAAAEAAINDGRIHYLALGDRHSTTRLGSTGRIWYSGAPVATAFDETDPNNTLLVELGPNARCEVQALAVGTWQFIATQRDVNGLQEVHELDQWLASLSGKERTVIKLGLSGTISLATAAALDETLERQTVLFASLRQWERKSQLTVMADQLDHDSVALTGYARRAWEELLGDAESDPTARQALQLLFRLSAGAKPQ